ncbi:dienelactone hydrolase family protein [Thermoleptolyngbya sichuanensis A183]|uniref:Dienelactone hydrolase family protein n=1 Tax=Thermoleptolyngbya sichuanensis A183 TaxID=2737172 RepID=A0A6M8BPK1_9CYAN|nr:MULTISPECIES: alpha/beta family hydrolase [Thermoleptolyngbya]QKD84235.1 dienelactone hydrolase family protein [Thermoleptolyngbya sichuanensis A183]
MGTEIANRGYLALPSGGSGPGVVVLQEWWGLVPHIKTVTDRFAEAGFVAIAPDLYDGETTTSPDEAGRLFMALNIEQTARKLEETLQYLQEHPAVTGDRLGVVGFCMGGQLALLAATLSQRVGAVVDFYGIHPNVQPDFSKLRAPVLGIFGENDGFVTPEAVRSLEAAIQQAGGSIETHTYTGADHAFFNDTRPEVYQPDAAADAWDKTLSFLRRELATA